MAEVVESPRPLARVAMLGNPNTGKTSLFNCISGVYRPQAGSIRFLGDELIGERELVSDLLS